MAWFSHAVEISVFLVLQSEFILGCVFIKRVMTITMTPTSPEGPSGLLTASYTHTHLDVCVAKRTHAKKITFSYIYISHSCSDLNLVCCWLQCVTAPFFHTCMTSDFDVNLCVTMNQWSPFASFFLYKYVKQCTVPCVCMHLCFWHSMTCKLHLFRASEVQSLFQSRSKMPTTKTSRHIQSADRLKNHLNIALRGNNRGIIL